MVRDFQWRGLTVRLSSTETRTEIFSVDVSEMRFTRVFFKSDDSITAIDVCPSLPGLICCANSSGRIFLYDYVRKVQVVENRLRLQKRRSSTSDTDIIETPHVSALAFSPDGRNLFCGLESGSVIALDPNVLAEMKSFRLTQSPIMSIKFSPDSTFVVVYVSCSSESMPLSQQFSHPQDEQSTLVVLHRDKQAQGEGWKVLGRLRYHTKAICGVLYISPAQNPSHASVRKVCPRLISLARDRVSFLPFLRRPSASPCE